LGCKPSLIALILAVRVYNFSLQFPQRTSSRSSRSSHDHKENQKAA
jgi:hypothetical protein